MTRVVFTVYGKPEPAGSKRAFALRKAGIATGKIAVVDDNPKGRSWKQEVAAAATAGMYEAGHTLVFTGPLGIGVTFFVSRPKGHFGTGRNADKLKDSAPVYPTTKPDATKLLRAVEDGMSGFVWRDDAQVVEQIVSKRYGDPPCAVVTVWTL